MDEPAKGFLPNASTLDPVIFPNEENPITKDANIIAIAKRYLSACTGVIKGDVKLFLIISSKFPLNPFPKNIVFMSNNTYICPISSLLF